MRTQLIQEGLWPHDDASDPGVSLNAAWRVVRTLVEHGLYLAVFIGADECTVEIIQIRSGRGMARVTGDLQHMPHTICEAALMAWQLHGPISRADQWKWRKDPQPSEPPSYGGMLT